MEYAAQQIGGGVKVYTSRAHAFGTDALLLADFAAPKRNAIACDLGTGCGIIPLYWYSRGMTAQAWGMDIQPQAVEQFRLGIASSCTDERASEAPAPLLSQPEQPDRLIPICGDLRELPPELPKGRFDLVSCNPPYQTGKGMQSELPADRIARHEVLCTIGDVCMAAEQLLKYGGKFCVCQKPERLSDVICAMREHGLEPKVLRFVAKEAEKEPWLFLLSGQKGANPGMRVLQTLPVYLDGAYSSDMLRIYGENFQPQSSNANP